MVGGVVGDQEGPVGEDVAVADGTVLPRPVGRGGGCVFDYAGLVEGVVAIQLDGVGVGVIVAGKVFVGDDDEHFVAK